MLTADDPQKKIVDPDEAYRKSVDKASFLSAAKSANIKINVAGNSDD